MRAALIVLILLVVGAIGYFLIGSEKAPKTDGAPVETSEETASPVTPDGGEAADTVQLPTFDLIRVDRTGFAVFSGRAEPSSTVEVLANGDLLVSVEAGPDGSFAREADTPLSTGPVELSLVMVLADGSRVTSPDTIVIYVPEGEGDAPVVLRTTPGGATEILQSADDPAGLGLGPLSIDSIDYDAAGNAIFAGRAEAGAVVQIITGQGLLGQTTADAAGRWVWEPPAPILPGRYTLRIVQLDDEGRPEYVIEVPFEQASFDEIVFQEGNVIVQPGNSLWVIARKVYGEGEQYTVIYGANADQIRDPDLIYPGQVFQVPNEEGEQTTAE